MKNENNWMMVGGLCLFLVGTYRAYPVKIDKAILLQWVPVFAMLAIAALALFGVDGVKGLAIALDRTGMISARLAPMLIGIVFVMAFGGVLAGYYKPQIIQMISGKYGVLGALAAAFITPTSATFAPQVTELWENPLHRPQLLVFLIASSMLSVPLFFIRQMGVTWDISVKMYICGIFISVLLYFEILLVGYVVPL